MAFLRERSGRWSPVRIVAFLATILPALWIAYQAWTGELGARPVTEAIHQSGDWALRLLLVTLAITPAQRILNYPRIALARRTLGVAAACYAGASSVALRPRSEVRSVQGGKRDRAALLPADRRHCAVGLIALGITSTDRMVQRLGSKRWNTLHVLAYPIAILAIMHFLLQTKLESPNRC